MYVDSKVDAGLLFAPMCRVFGCVATEPISVRHDLVEAANPLVRQSEEHDSGWGMAVYRHAEGEEPRCFRFPEPAHENDEFLEATNLRGRLFNVHVRRATMGGLTRENTHPFCMGPYSFCHNGTIVRYPKLLEHGVLQPQGQTDSEAFFNFLMHDFDPEHPRRSLRRSIRAIIERSPFSGLNFLLSDGERLYAYKLGIFELYWTARDGALVVASERITESDHWHHVQDDVLLVLDRRDMDEPHAEHLVGNSWVQRAEIMPVEGAKHLRGEERGEFAAARAAEAGSDDAA
jgi:glutamine amidotransferase